MSERVVLDTNVLVSAFIHHRGNEWKILDLVREGIIQLILSKEILDEFQKVIARGKFGFSTDLIIETVVLVIEIAEIIVPQSRLDIVHDDPSDNKFIECAIDGNADYVISGDRHLLDIGNYREVKILKAKDFLNIMKVTPVKDN